MATLSLRDEAAGLLQELIRLDIGRIHLRIFGDAPRQGRELHRLQKSDQFAGVGLVHREIVQRDLQLDLVIEQHQLP